MYNTTLYTAVQEGSSVVCTGCMVWFAQLLISCIPAPLALQGAERYWFLRTKACRPNEDPVKCVVPQQQLPKDSGIILYSGRSPGGGTLGRCWLHMVAARLTDLVGDTRNMQRHVKFTEDEWQVVSGQPNAYL